MDGFHLPLLSAGAGYDEACAAFRWPVPLRFNIARACLDHHAAHTPEKTALLEVGEGFGITPVTYIQLQRAASQLAHALHKADIGRGERVAILLPQGWFVPVAHMAAYKIGAIALPLAALFGVDAIAYRLEDAQARVIITDATGVEKLKAILNLPASLTHILSLDGEEGQAQDYHRFVSGQPDTFTTRDTLAEDPALMIYTSGTTGQPKGALHAHRVLIGHFPGVEMSHDFFPQADDRLWTPADWAWAGGLLNVLLPGLAYGVPVIAWPFQKFDPEAAFSMMAGLSVRNAFIPPTGLRLMRGVENPVKRFGMPLRSLASGGESLGTPTFDWGREVLGLPINEFYGQTECNYVLASSHRMGVTKAGMIGKSVPGHQVRVIRADGTFADIGERGQIAVRRPNPAMFLTYWRREAATAEKFIGDWMTTGDQGFVDEEGYIGFFGRDDDVITSSGYRIGPVEIEDCLIKHEAVALAAVIGVPDAVRTEIVTAYVMLKPGFARNEALAESIRQFVRARLSAHEYPRAVHFVDELPLTTTGKVIRRVLREKTVQL